MGTSPPNSGFRHSRWVACMGSIYATEISKCYKARVLPLYPRETLVKPTSTSAQTTVETSLCRLSLTISSLRRATDSCDLVTDSWNLRTGGDVKGHHIPVTSFIFFLVSWNTASPWPVCLDISNLVSFSLLYFFTILVHSHLLLVSAYFGGYSLG